MIIKYKITTSENDDFLLEIELPKDKTFMDFHYAIVQACDYDPQMPGTFFLSDQMWDYHNEIIIERFDEESQANLLLMEETNLEHFNPFKGQRYLYVFDDIMQRGFFIEISNIRPLKQTEKLTDFPKFKLKEKPPKQFEIDSDFDKVENEDVNNFEENFDDIDNLDDLDYEDYSDSYDDY